MVKYINSPSRFLSDSSRDVSRCFLHAKTGQAQGVPRHSGRVAAQAAEWKRSHVKSSKIFMKCLALPGWQDSLL